MIRIMKFKSLLRFFTNLNFPPKKSIFLLIDAKSRSADFVHTFPGFLYTAQTLIEIEFIWVILSHLS